MSFGDNSSLGVLNKISPQRSYLWNLFLPIAGTSPDLAWKVSQLCRKVDFGNGLSMEVNKTKEGSFTTFTSGPLMVSGVTMSFLIPEDADPVLSYFKAWFNLIVNGQSQHAPKAN